jgi:PAS domain S-box-containing protein
MTHSGFPLQRYIWALAGAWTVIIAGLLAWAVYEARQDAQTYALVQAEISYQKDILYRRWNTSHGGVYAPVTDATPPNPYLNVPERDITTTSGMRLTLINPAYMTRQVYELAHDNYGIIGHLTSLKPIRPQNAPDDWERQALQAFEQGQTEAFSIETLNGQEYMRLIRPFVTEAGCLKCHAAQGYQEGQIRGGISMAVPMAPLWAVTNARISTMAQSYAALWLIGLGAFWLGARRLRQSELVRQQAEAALRQLSRAVEQSPVLIVITNLAGDIEYVNPKFCQVTGYTREEAMGHTPRILKSGEKTPEEYKQLWDTILAGGEWRGEFHNKKKNGELYWESAAISPITDAQGNITHFLAVKEDITARKQAEEQLRAALAQREWLVRDTYHRVKNNLMVVENLLRFQADYVADAAIQEMFKESRTRVRSMLLIHEKLHQSQDLTQVDFAGYLRKLTVDLFRAYQSPAVPVELIVEVEDIFLSADTATSCGLIINELVSNALKHAFSANAPAAGNKLWVSLQTEGDRYVLSVRDNGKGFPADKDFQNTDSLGMQIVAMKAQDLQGTIELCRDGGTLFRIAFPQT